MLFLFKEHTKVWMTLDVEPKHQAIMLNHMAPRGLAEVIQESTGTRVWFSQENSFISSTATANAAATSITNLSTSSNSLSVSPRRSGFYAPRFCPTQNLLASSFGLYQRPEARTMISIFGSVHGCFMARQTLMVSTFFLILSVGVIRVFVDDKLKNNIVTCSLW